MLDHTRIIHTPTPPQDDLERGRILLRDGAVASLRVVRQDDVPRLVRFLEVLSADSLYLRFLAAFPPSGAAATWSTQRDPTQALSLVVTRTREAVEEILAIGTYIRVSVDAAEVAFAVADAAQGSGLGTILLERLAQIARGHGFVRFAAICHPENFAMRRVFEDSGFRVAQVTRDCVTRFDIDLEPVARTIERMDQRDHDATVASLSAVFAPRTIAVVGVSRGGGGIGNRVIAKIQSGGFTGEVYPVNLAGPCRSVADVPGRVDLAVLCVPREAAAAALSDAGRAGARAAVVITAGFAEVGPYGAALQDELVTIARGHGMRLVGPNCLGVVNSDPAVRLDATFMPVAVEPGNVLVGSQSGALGLAVLARSRELGVGVSTFVSLGNKADVSGNDLLLYGESDPRTRVILLYLESLGNPRRFARIAQRVSRSKPIVCLKAGRSAAGQRAAGSHTAAVATADATLDALFAQGGVLRAETLEEMFELASLLGSEPLPAGKRVAVLTNAGGPAILCADALAASGLELAALAPATNARLAGALPRAASLANPVDMIASATPADYRAALDALLDDAQVDAVLFIHVPLSEGDERGVREAVAAAVVDARARGVTRTVAGCVLGAGRAAPIVAGAERVPVFAFPESAARALCSAAAYAAWRAEDPGVELDFEDVDVGRARRACDAALERGDDVWLAPGEVGEVLEAFGIPTLTARLARDVEAAVDAAAFTGYPVALKLVAPGLLHKSDVGGVELGVTDPVALRVAYARLMGVATRAGFADQLDGVLVQRMAAPGVELMAGIARDPRCGPVLAFGLGGVDVEVVRDLVFRLPPLTDRDAREMVSGLRGRRALQGYRGRPRADVPALTALLLRLSRLAGALGELEELDLNPVIAHAEGHGATVVDARIRVRRGT